MLPIDAFRESVTTIDGRNLSWLDWGADRPDPPVICLHGAMGMAHVWDGFASALASERRVIALDLRGHGDSAPVSPPQYRLRDYRADVEALLARLEIRRYALVGHSMGGLVALQLAGAHPKAVRRLAVVDIEARPPAEQIEHLRAVGARGHRVLADYESTLRAARAFLPGADEELVGWMVPYLFRRVSGGHVPKWDPEALAGLERWNAEPWLARVRCPSLLVRGARTTVMREEVARAMADQMDHCDLITIPDAGHQVMLEQPDAFRDVVASFLLERESGAG